jgi:hypothetical protein
MLSTARARKCARADASAFAGKYPKEFTGPDRNPATMMNLNLLFGHPSW